MDSKEFEGEYVTSVYNRIANGFNRTRQNRWPQVVEFINSLPEKSLIGDIGCGNGRFMLTRKDCEFEGCDRTQAMVDICQEQGLKVKQGDVTNIPFPNDYFDGLVCIAVIHHLATEERRKQAIRELIRVVKPGGKILIEVWSYEASIGSKFKFQTIEKEGFNEQDKFLSWSEPNKPETTNTPLRYYHLFKEEEFKSLVLENEVELVNCFLDHGNWFLSIVKQ